MYGQFNGNPAYNGYPAMQNRLGGLDAQYGQSYGSNYPTFNRQQTTLLKGRMVTSVDEAKASQFDLDGSITYFPSPAENKIYAKTLDNNGLPIFLEFVQTNPIQPKEMECNVVDSLVKRIERIEKELGYESDGVNANNAK